MKNKTTNSCISLIIIISTLLLSSCGGDNFSLTLNPLSVNSFYTINGATVFYMDATNNSTNACEISIEEAGEQTNGILTKSIKVLSPLFTTSPPKIAPNTTIRITYEVVDWNKAKATTPNLNIQVRWDNWSGTHSEYEFTIQWTTPITLVETSCWISDEGDGHNFFRGILGEHPLPTSTGTGLRYNQINAIHNPNNFDIKLMVKWEQRTNTNMLVTCPGYTGREIDVCADNKYTWVVINANTTLFNFQNYVNNIDCKNGWAWAFVCTLNSPIIVKDINNKRWIEIKVFK